MLGKTEGRKRRGATEDEMVGWHHRLNGLEFEQIPGDSEGQRSLACCIHVWWPSFYSSHPKKAPLDYRALIGKCSCIHKSQRTVANKETVFNGHRNNL